ncbi:uncharacterized protein LOC117112387 [Anneissia japonica]|uniref:uncharacterized protein LOC117112387 n=1 Tax=Anneissia japonica TaxID=1529436 RepID=UPI0014255FF5|nr:uncharacterized protein LOC117112387 [Anneissia japonica]
MPGARTNRQLCFVGLLMVMLALYGWIKLFMMTMTYDFHPRHASIGDMKVFSTELKRSHDWYHKVCFNGLRQEFSISRLEDFQERWKVSSQPDCRSTYNMFERIYDVKRRSGQIIVPDTFQTKLLKWLGNSEDLLREAKLQVSLQPSSGKELMGISECFNINTVDFETSSNSKTSCSKNQITIMCIRDRRLSAIRYAKENGGNNYFTELLQVHNALGLATKFGNASAMAYLTPKNDNEVIIMSKTANLDFFRLLFYVIKAFTEDMKLYAWSLAMFLPKLEPWVAPGFDDIPALVRIVSRGPVNSPRSDISAMELFGVSFALIFFFLTNS